MGENIQREWNAEPAADALWQALQVLRRDRDAGIAELTELARGGSALAMMFLGHALLSGDADGAASGEQWLIRAVEGGSIEAGYQLAFLYLRQDDWSRASAALEALAAQGYAPAQYLLGRHLYYGTWCERSVPRALHYLRNARRAGHLGASGLLSWIYRKERIGRFWWITTHWLCLAKLPSVGWCLWHYPNSDRLRGHPAAAKMPEGR